MIDLKNQKWYSIQAVGARAKICDEIKIFKKSFKKSRKNAWQDDMACGMIYKLYAWKRDGPNWSSVSED